MELNRPSPDVEDEMAVIGQQKRVFGPDMNFEGFGVYVFKWTVKRIIPVEIQKVMALRMLRNTDIRNNLI